MRYEDFITEFQQDIDWNKKNRCRPVVADDGEVTLECYPEDSDENLDALEEAIERSEGDMVNSPDHYTRGSQEAIVTIEEAIADAPGPITGMLQAQVLKYLLRLWNKENAVQDAKKAQWYLDRLIEKLEY